MPVAEKKSIINAMKKVKYSSFFTFDIPLPSNSNDLLNLPSFKIAMTLAALSSDEPEIICSDLDFKTSLDLVEKVYLRHSIRIHNKINKDSKRLNKTQDELLNWMKSKGEIKRGDVWNKAKTMGIKERTLADILRKFLDLDLIKKVTHGVYMVR